MPPKKKKARTSSPKEPEEPLEFATFIRETSGKTFANTGRRKKNVNYDIEQNIREIRALLKINAEIFDRCMSSASNYDGGPSAVFTRFGFHAVKVRDGGNAALTEFITDSERSQQTFDMMPLSKLPAGLDDVFVVKYQAAPSEKFIDYDAFFRNALMLHDDILEPFLARLKSHIESIHVRLGEIETWLLEPKSNHEFIESTFGKKLEIPTDGNDVQDWPYHGANVISSDLCAACGRSYGSHSHHYAGAGLYKRYCNSGGVFKYKKPPKIHILKSCSESGKFEKTFEISKQSDQTKLKKFLEFVAS